MGEDRLEKRCLGVSVTIREQIEYKETVLVIGGTIMMLSLKIWHLISRSYHVIF